MAESVNGGSNTPAQPPKEMSMEVRLLLAFLLMGAVMFVTPYFFKSRRPASPARSRRRQTAAQGRRHASTRQQPGGRRVPRRAAGRSRGDAAPLPAGATPQQPQPPLVIDTDLLHGHVQQSGRDRAQLAARRSTRATTASRSTWSTPRPAWTSLLALFPEHRSPPPTSTGPTTSRPPIPTAWASPTSFPTATPPSARSSASRRTAISRRCRPRSRSTASRCRT